MRESRLVKKVRGNLTNLRSEALYVAAKDGDALSLQLVRELGRLNAIGFANVIDAYDPALITVGGTVAFKNEKLVLPFIREQVEEYAVNRVPKIIMTPLGEEVGIYGGVAAAVALRVRISNGKGISVVSLGISKIILFLVTLPVLSMILQFAGFICVDCLNGSTFSALVACVV